MVHSIPSQRAAKILLTRPQRQSERFADILHKQLGDHLEIEISPILEIRFIDPEVDLTRVDGLVFTSENGVSGLARVTPRRDLAAYCVGDRTAEVAREAGFEARSAHGDVDALAEMLVRSAGGKTLLYARGKHIARDLQPMLGCACIDLNETVVYDQAELPLSEVARALLAGTDPVLIPLFSPRSARLLCQSLDRSSTAPCVALCLSKAVAEGCPPGLFDVIAISGAPNLQSMVELIKRYCSH
ncbi:MAG: uroporphyrinogen-III synthase [Litoreibacter sp.]|nr:uroporphyrinogen-III synthase [Litoreibacter sp.]